MNYEQKYNEALERAEAIYTGKYKPEIAVFAKKSLETIFPELEAYEDERRRKAIHIYLDWLDGRKDCAPRGEYSIRDMIAWLKKQCEQKPTWTDNDRTMAFTLLRDVDQMTYISNEGKNERFEWLNSLEDKFKQ